MGKGEVVMQRGEVWWANLPSPFGRRPVVLISRDRAIRVRNSVTVAQLTSTQRNLHTEVRVGQEDGLPKECVINCDTIHTIHKSLLSNRITLLSQSKREALNYALRFALDLL